MAYFRMSGGGGSKELHGAIINVTTEVESLFGQNVYLYLGDVLKQTKKFSDDGRAVFNDIQEVGAYIVKVDDEKIMPASLSISADNIINKTILKCKLLETAVYYGTITPLNQVRWKIKGASVPGYALFAGGAHAIPDVDAYNTSLTRTSATQLSAGRHSFTSVSLLNSYALFMGGCEDITFTYPKDVEVYNSSLIRTNPTSIVSGEYPTSANVNNYSLVFGGNNASGLIDTVYAINKSLSVSTAQNANNAVFGATGVSVNNKYALFFGGKDEKGVHDNYIQVYSSSLTKLNDIIPPTSKWTGLPAAAASLQDKAVLYSTGGVTLCLNDSLTVTTYNYSLWLTGESNCAINLKDTYALFPSSSTGQIRAVDKYFTLSTPEQQSGGRAGGGSAVTGDYAIFAGGYANSSYVVGVDAYYA